MATEQQLATAKQYFESNPDEGVLHISTDGQVFFQKNYNDGATHQRRIDPAQKMTTIFRKDIQEIGVVSSSSTHTDVPIDKMTKAQLTALLSEYSVKTTGKEKVDELRKMAFEAFAAADGEGGEDDSHEDDND